MQFTSDAESGWQWASASGDAAEASDPDGPWLAAKWQKFIEKHEQSDEKIFANKEGVRGHACCACPSILFAFTMLHARSLIQHP
jgi:hypothetical protein